MSKEPCAFFLYVQHILQGVWPRDYSIIVLGLVGRCRLVYFALKVDTNPTLPHLGYISYQPTAKNLISQR